MFRLHIHENDIEEIEQKATIFKSDSIDSFFTNFLYEIKKLRLLNNGILYIIYFGTVILKEVDFVWTNWLADQENILLIIINNIYL